MLVVGTDIIGVRLRSAIHEPDVVIPIDKNARHLLHAPSIRQGLRPEWIDLEQWRAIAIDSVRPSLLQRPGGTRGEHQDATNEGRRVHAP